MPSLFEVRKMVKPWTARFAAALIVGFLLFPFVGVSPAGAMIFPDLLKLVRVDHPAAPETPGDKTGEKAGSEKDLQTVTYIVKTGDTLWEISRRYNVDYKAIAKANNIGDNCIIHAGQKLNIPCEGTIIHVVRPGESLWQIARKYGISVEQLAKVNQITDPKKLRVGKSLVISRGESVPVTGVSAMPSRGSGLWKWPVIGPITQRYGGVNLHHGLDIAAETGTKIYPLRPGVVEFSGWLNRIYGRAVIIDHGNGIKTLYAHNSQNLVKEGDYVGTSSPIGKIGSTGRATGPHLHLEVHVGDKTVDPQRYLGSQPGS